MLSVFTNSQPLGFGIRTTIVFTAYIDRFTGEALGISGVRNDLQISQFLRLSQYFET